MRYAVSFSTDYLGGGAVVIRDFNSVPKGRVLCIITRDSKYESELTAQFICDLLNKEEKNEQS